MDHLGDGQGALLALTDGHGIQVIRCCQEPNSNEVCRNDGCFRRIIMGAVEDGTPPIVGQMVRIADDEWVPHSVTVLEARQDGLVLGDSRLGAGRVKDTWWEFIHKQRPCPQPDSAGRTSEAGWTVIVAAPKPMA